MCKIDFKEIKRYVVRHKNQNWQLNYQIEKKIHIQLIELKQFKWID